MLGARGCSGLETILIGFGLGCVVSWLPRVRLSDMELSRFGRFRGGVICHSWLGLAGGDGGASLSSE